MPTVDVVRETQLSRSIRARQLESAFDVPPRETARLEWHGSIDCESRDWNVGLIVGPSGSGKTSILHDCFGRERELQWGAPAVIDDFSEQLGLQEITEACESVGFNTIPAWLRPHRVLSNGEQFRAKIARLMLETPRDEIIVIDEFTSVVDRQVAKIASHAVQRSVRRNKRRLVAASCHYDIIDWLQPDWILEPATMSFQWRELRRRPDITCEIQRVDYKAWQIFAPFHYLTNDLNKAAACFVLFVDASPTAFAGMLHRPHPKTDDICGLSRVVTLPDFQGLGLAFILMETLASAYRAIGKRFHTYPAHPALIRSFDKSNKWALIKRPGIYSPRTGSTTALGTHRTAADGGFGGRPCAVFEYAGDAMTLAQANALLAGHLAREAA